MGRIIQSPTSAIPLSLSSLVCLENLTIGADLVFLFNNDYRYVGDNIYGFCSPIPAIAQLLNTTSSLPLQHLTLDFNFDINHDHLLPYDHEALWSPLVSLVSESSCPSINLRIKVSELQRFTLISPEVVLSSLASCAALTRMVEISVWKSGYETGKKTVTGPD